MFGVGASAGENDGDIESNAEGRSRRPNDHSPSSVTTSRAPLNFGQYRGASDSAADTSGSMSVCRCRERGVGAAALAQFLRGTQGTLADLVLADEAAQDTDA